MANAMYTLGRQKFLEGSIAYLTDTIKVALVKSTYTPNLATHEFLSDLGANTVATDQTLASKTSTGGTADAADVSFSSVPSGATVAYIAIYKSTGTASTSPLICLFDTATGLSFSTNGGTATITWSNGSDKIFTL